MFKDFGYDSEEFVKKIVGEKTSHYNESIHSLLFRMVMSVHIKAIDMNIMKLGYRSYKIQ